MNSCAQSSYHNSSLTLELIKNADDLINLVKKLDTTEKFFEVPEQVSFLDKHLDSIAHEFYLKPYYKVDLDADKITDLIILYSNQSIYYIYFDNNYKLNLKYIQGSRAKLIFPQFIKGKVLFESFKLNSIINNAEWTTEVNHSKLIFIDGSFIERNEKPKIYKIESIIFSTEGCYGECPIFELKINKNLAGFYNAIEFNTYKGHFIAHIDKRDYNKIVSLLNYIDFPKLNSQYNVGWTDDQTCQLKIKYNGGQVKLIRDYGQVGTYGLSQLYSYLYLLRENQKWRRK